MGTPVLLAVVVAITTPSVNIQSRTVAKQNETFKRLWGTDFVWKYSELPEKGSVPESRIPYSGYIYPDKSGGTINAMRKYDLAFNGGRYRATGFEQYDTTAYKKPTERRGFLGLARRTVMETPNWHGHCNGWAAAAIRHAEPEHSVQRNGVTFSPADIKAMLAEIYMYNDFDHLLGLDDPLNAGAFHAIVANWVGRGSHGLGMEADPSEEKWNYPIYGYATSSAQRPNNRVEVKMNLAYAKDSNGEYQESPRIQRIKYFHYMLELNGQGNIVGGYFFNDSAMIDMLWIPMRPKKSGLKGNEGGNTGVDVDQVLAIWRDSVPAETRHTWLVVDPPKLDRVLNVAEIDSDSLIPVQDLEAAAKPQIAITSPPTVPTPPTAAPKPVAPTPEGTSARWSDTVRSQTVGEGTASRGPDASASSPTATASAPAATATIPAETAAAPSLAPTSEPADRSDARPAVTPTPSPTAETPSDTPATDDATMDTPDPEAGAEPDAPTEPSQDDPSID